MSKKYCHAAVVQTRFVHSLLAFLYRKRYHKKINLEIFVAKKTKEKRSSPNEFKMTFFFLYFFKTSL